MPVYEYKCGVCNLSWDLSATIQEYDSFAGYDHCPYCGAEDKVARVFSFSVKPTMAEHMNNTTGQVVSSERQFKDQLKRQSEEATIRTGIEHNFVPVDHNDRQTLGVTSEGLDATYNRRKELGMRIPEAIKPGNMD